MDNLTQGVIGGSLYTLITKKHTTKDFLLGAVIANLGDFDVFVGPLLPLGPLDTFFFHRGIMHSVGFAIVSSAIISYFLYRADKSVAYWRYLLACLVAMFGGHLLIDAMTSYGMRFWLPWSNHTVSTDNIFVIDAGMWIITIGGFITYLSKQSKHFKQHVAGRILGLSASYFALSFVLQGYAEQVFQAQAPLLTEQATYKTIAQPLQIALWRHVIKDESGYYVGYYSIFDKNTDIDRQYVAQDPEDMAALESLVAQDSELQRHYDLVKDFGRDYLRVTRIASGYLIETMVNGPVFGREHTQKRSRPFNFEVIANNTGDYEILQSHSIDHLELTRAARTKFWRRVWGIR